MSIHEHTRSAWEDASQKHVREYAEHLEPFWRPDGEEPAAAWDGRLPNTLSLLARRA